MVLLALVPGLVTHGWPRVVAVAASVLGAFWIAFGAEPWELLPFRDERILSPLAGSVGEGIGAFYRVLLPLSPEANPEMHGLVLMAIFGFVLAISLLASASHPLGAAAVTVAGAGWAATLVDGETVALGALALGAALSAPLILRARSGSALVAGLAAGVVVVATAMWASSATGGRTRGGGGLGELGLPEGLGAGDGSPVRVGLELRRHPFPADEDGCADRRRAGAGALLADVHARPLCRRPLVRRPSLARAGARRFERNAARPAHARLVRWTGAPGSSSGSR